MNREDAAPMSDAARMILELPDDAHVSVGLVREAFGVGRMVPDECELMVRHMVRLCTQDLRCPDDDLYGDTPPNEPH